MSLSIHQEVFTLFFAIFYGTATSITGWLHPFATHECWYKGIKSEVFRRFIVSVLCLNLVPFIYFIVIFIQLENRNTLEPFGLLVTVILSLAAFGFYRIYAGIAVYAWSHLYTADQWYKIREKRIENFNEEETYCKITIGDKTCSRRTFDNPGAHFWPGIFYVLIPPVLLYIYMIVFH